MNIWKRSLPILTIAVLAASCTKPTNIGSEIIPGNDYLNRFFTDTVSIVSVSELDDSLPTYNQSYYLLGTLNDVLFGKSYAGLFSQVRLPSGNVDLGENLDLDSIVLTLRYNSLYGDPNARHSVNIYQITDNMVLNEPYRSHQTFGYNPIPIGRKSNFKPKASVVDSILVGGIKRAPHLRIKLDNSFGEMFLSQSGTANFASQSAFNDFFKGFYIAPDTGTGYSNSILFFDMIDGLSAMTVYYSNSSSDSLSATFPINSNCAISNFFKHQYSNAQILDEISGQVEMDSVNYLQGMAGVRVKIKFPWLKNLGKISINHAELVITQAPQNNLDTLFVLPQNVIPRIVADTSATEFEALIDEAWASLVGNYAFSSGLLVISENGKKFNRYKINLLRHLQLIIDDKTDDLELVVKIIPSASSANMVSIGGGNHPNPDLRMKLNLTYSKIE